MCTSELGALRNPTDVKVYGEITRRLGSDLGKLHAEATNKSKRSKHVQKVTATWEVGCDSQRGQVTPAKASEG